MKKTVAIYKNLACDFMTPVLESLKAAYAADDNFVQLTEFVEVDFPDIPDVDINTAKVKAIDKQINNALAILESLERQKKDLLCISHDIQQEIDNE